MYIMYNSVDFQFQCLSIGSHEYISVRRTLASLHLYNIHLSTAIMREVSEPDCQVCCQILLIAGPKKNYQDMLYLKFCESSFWPEFILQSRGGVAILRTVTFLLFNFWATWTLMERLIFKFLQLKQFLIN